MRYSLIILGMCLAAIAVGTGLYLYGPDEFRQNPLPEGGEASAIGANLAEAVSYTVLAEGQNAQIRERKNFGVYTEEEFRTLWQQTYGENAPALPEVDFTRMQVIGVFAGEKPTGGYAIAVSGVTDENTVRTISITISRPGEGCMTTQALTSPFQFVAVPLSDRTLAKADQEVTASCQ